MNLATNRSAAQPQILALLSAEERQLTQILDAADQLRPALLSRNPDDLLERVRQLERLHEQASTVANRRPQLKALIAQLAETTIDQATLPDMRRTLSPSEYKPIEEQRRRLSDLARRVRQSHIRNLAVAGEFSQLIQRVLEVITGQSSSESYGPSGELRSGSTTSMFQAEL